MSLTAKQEKFCHCIVSGMTGKDSYLTAYDSKGSDQNAYNEASKLLLREDIQKYIESLRKPIEKAIQTSVISEREKKRNILWSFINDPNKTDADRLKAMDLLNKMDAEYVNITKNIDDKAAEIKHIDSDTLKKLVG